MKPVVLLAVSFVFLLTTGSGRAFAKDRVYYIAADDVIWDYAPLKRNLISGEPFGEEDSRFTVAGDYRLGSRLKKALYREYTDQTFTTLKERGADWAHLGFMGPLIRAEVGDTIVIHFRNNASIPASMHPHGVFYAKDAEGAPYNDGTKGKMKADDRVSPGGTHIYRWEVTEEAGPLDGGPSTAFWMYHSHADEARDVDTGLLGPMIVTRKGAAKSDADLSPKDVDREFVISFNSTSESNNHYVDDNIQAFAGKPEGFTPTRSPFNGRSYRTPEGITALPRENMNGYMFGNMPMPTMKVGEKVRWYVMSGSGFDLHAAHWHAHTVRTGNMRTDTIGLITMEMAIADMLPNNPGIWLFHCHVGGHMANGMISRYEVTE